MIVYDEEERAYIPENDGRKIGKFTLSPNFMVGDVQPNNAVDATDASLILQAVAKGGASGELPETFLPLDEESQRFQPSDALLFADADESGNIDASDASIILIYSAMQGSGEEVPPMGEKTFFADGDGFLQRGLFQDGENSYYADEHYQLCYGWQED